MLTTGWCTADFMCPPSTTLLSFYDVPFMCYICCCRVPLLQSLIGLFELPEDDSTPDDEHFIEIEDTPGTGTHTTAETQLQKDKNFGPMKKGNFFATFVVRTRMYE